MNFWPRALWWRIWLAVLAAIVVFAVAAGTAWRVFFDPARLNPNAEAVAELVAEQLPAAAAPQARQRAALEHAHREAEVDLALVAADGTLIAVAGRPLPPPDIREADSHWLMPRVPPAGAEARGGRPRRPAFALHLPDGRWLVVRREAGGEHPPPFGRFGMLVVMALAVGVGAYPVARRLTRRLERLQASVDALGAGDLSTRVEVEGRDEVARLAERFNTAAVRIEALVNAQKSLLANASHELRSPLARIRMAVEILGERPSPELLDEVRASVGELDTLVEEILLASRLDAPVADLQDDEIDLAALVAEECARAEVAFEAEPLDLRGDARLLRRLLRNLIENAQRYGAGTPAEVSLRRAEAYAVIEVCDRGPGIPEAERERIFEPFYRTAGGRERDGGVGLGLALVRQIAQRHGGTVACGARAGGGACFTVRLPLARGTKT